MELYEVAMQYAEEVTCQGCKQLVGSKDNLVLVKVDKQILKFCCLCCLHRWLDWLEDTKDSKRAIGIDILPCELCARHKYRSSDWL